MKNFSKIALLTVLSFLTISEVLTETPAQMAARLAATAPVVAKTDPTPLPTETLEKQIDDPKLTEVAPPAELKKEEDKVVPASVAPEKELAAPAASAKSSWSLSSAFSGAISSVKGLFTSKSKTEAKKEEPKPTITEPLAVEPEKAVPVEKTETEASITDPVAEKLASKEPLVPMTDDEKVAFLGSSSPLKKSSSALATATALATGIKLPTAAPSIEPTTKTPEPEKVMPSPTVEEEKVLTLKTGSATRAAQAATEKIATEDDVLDVPASKKEVDEAALTIKATANPTDTAELKIRDYWETKNTKDRRATQIKRTLAAAAITTLAGGLIGITVVLPIVLRIMAKKLEAEEQAHLERLQAEARGAQAKLDSLGEAATDLDKMMVQQLGLDPDRLYKDSAFNKERGKETQSPTLKKLFRMLNHEPKQFLDAVEILREKEVAKLLTPREQEQLSIIRNLRPEDVAPLGFFGSLGKFFGFGPQSNDTLDKIRSSWKKEYKSDEIAKLKEKHGAKTTTSEPAKKAEDDQKLKTTPPAEAQVDAAKKPKTPEELASEAAAKKQSLLDSRYPEHVVEKMLSQETVNQTLKKKGTLIPEMATLDKPVESVSQPKKASDLDVEEVAKLTQPRPSTAAGSIKRESKKDAIVAVPGELIEEVEKPLPVPDKIVPLPEETKTIVPTLPALAPVITEKPSGLVPPPAPTLEDQKIPAAAVESAQRPQPVPVEPANVALTAKERKVAREEARSIAQLKDKIATESTTNPGTELKFSPAEKEVLGRMSPTAQLLSSQPVDYEALKKAENDRQGAQDQLRKDQESKTSLPVPAATEKKKEQEPVNSDQKLKDNPTSPIAAQNPPKIVVIDKTADDEAEITPMAKRSASTPKKQPGGKELALPRALDELGSETEGTKGTFDPKMLEESEELKQLKADTAEIQRSREEVVKINEETKQKLVDNLAEQERLKKLIETAQADFAKRAEIEGKIAEIEKDKKDLDETLKDVEKVEETFKGTEARRKELLEKLEEPQRKLNEIAVERENAVAEINGMKELSTEIEKTRNDMRTANPEERTKLQNKLDELNKQKAELINKNDKVQEIDKKFAKQQDVLIKFNHDAETFRMVTELNNLNNPIKQALDVVVRPELKRLKAKMDKMAEEKKIKKAQEAAEKLKNQANIKVIDNEMAKKQAELDQKLLQQAKEPQKETQQSQKRTFRPTDTQTAKKLIKKGFDVRGLSDANNLTSASTQVLLQEAARAGLTQTTSLIDPAQSTADQFMPRPRRSGRPAPLSPQTDNWGPNPEVERLTQSVGFGFGSQDPVVISTTEKQAILDRAKQLRPQVTAALAEQERTNPPSSPRSPIEVKNSPGRFWSANTTDRSLEEIETARQKGLSMINQGLQSPAVIRPEDIQRQFSTNPPPQKIGSFIKKTK